MARAGPNDQPEHAMNETTNPPAPSARSQPHQARNLLDRLTRPSTLQAHYRWLESRERELLERTLQLTGGTVLSVGCGWNPGRHLFPAPAFRIIGVDADPAKVAGVIETGRADAAYVGEAGDLRSLGSSPGGEHPGGLGALGSSPGGGEHPGGLGARGSSPPAECFDVVLYRLVLHHVAYQGPLAPCFEEAARLLRPAGTLVAIEPGLWHPVGAALGLANRAGLATAIHGTPDDIPLSPRRLLAEARAANLEPELHALTYAWRRLPRRLRGLFEPLDAVGSRPRAAYFGHTLVLLARKPERA